MVEGEYSKLDVVGLVDITDPPLTSSTTFPPKKNIKKSKIYLVRRRVIILLGELKKK